MPSAVYILENGEALTAGSSGGRIRSMHPDRRWRDYLTRHQLVRIDELVDRQGRLCWCAERNPDFNPRAVPPDADKGGTDCNPPFVIRRISYRRSEDEKKAAVFLRVADEFNAFEVIDAVVTNNTTMIQHFKDRLAAIRSEIAATT